MKLPNTTYICQVLSNKPTKTNNTMQEKMWTPLSIKMLNSQLEFGDKAEIARRTNYSREMVRLAFNAPQGITDAVRQILAAGLEIVEARKVSEAKSVAKFTKVVQ